MVADEMLATVSDQKLRNVRHRYVCIGECGVVAKNMDDNEVFQQ